MNSRTLTALLVSLAILVALAFAVSVSQRPAATGSGLLLPDLRAQLNDIDKIVVRSGGDKTIATLTRGKEGWTLTERNGYAADVGRIRKNLIGLAEARILEEKTSNPELYSRLRVEDIEKEGAGGVRLDLSAGDKTTGIIIGNTGVGGGDRAYARRVGDPVSWLVSGTFETPRESAEWLDRSLTDIAATRVHAVTISHPDSAALRVEKATPEAADFAVLDVPAGRELAYPAVGGSIGAGLADLTFDSAEPAAGFAAGDVKPVVARFETFDGLVVEVSTFRLPAGLRLRFSAAADQALADRFAPQPESKPDGDKPTAAAAAPASVKRKSFDEVKVEAERLNARLANWVYVLPDFKTEQLTKKPEDLLQPRAPGK